MILSPGLATYNFSLDIYDSSTPNNKNQSNKVEAEDKGRGHRRKDWRKQRFNGRDDKIN